MKKQFIKQNAPFDRNASASPAIRFRRTFFLPEHPVRARLSVCGLGYGYYYINGKSVTSDLFTAATSDYDKTLWYNMYDVTPLLQAGESAVCAILGNGFFNENFPTPWRHNEAPWRDAPKLALELDIDGRIVGVNELWKCKPDPGMYYNQLRSGEYFDATMYEENWNTLGYDDSDWAPAAIDETPPKGKMRLCRAEPIRALAEYPTVSVLKNGRKHVFDIGQNIAGYARIRVCQPSGTELILRYAEEIDGDNNLKLNNLDLFQRDAAPFQTDRLICRDGETVWHPRFTYKGFRYVEIEGLTVPPSPDMVTGIFCHNDVRRTADFVCSDELLNKIYACGIMSSFSNMYYVLTDCPTREKLGWTNDAQASCEQLCYNFGLEKFFEKWARDLRDAMQPDGSMPGIVPTPGTCFGHGPVCDGLLFELPDRLYQFYGNKRVLKACLPYMERYLVWLERALDEGAAFSLADWTGTKNYMTDDTEFINRAHLIKFYAILARGLAAVGRDNAAAVNRLREEKEAFARKYIGADGRCTIDEQTAISVLICLELGDPYVLGMQLTENIDKKYGGHQHTGMVGIQYLYDALSRIGRSEYVYKILTAGEPSVGEWIRRGATTLWEMWNEDTHTFSKNHHMYSACLAWFHKYVLGIKVEAGCVREVEPLFVQGLDFAHGYFRGRNGRVSVSWQRDKGGITLRITPEGGRMDVAFRGRRLKRGENIFYLSEKQIVSDPDM